LKPQASKVYQKKHFAVSARDGPLIVPTVVQLLHLLHLPCVDVLVLPQTLQSRPVRVNEALSVSCCLMSPWGADPTAFSPYHLLQGEWRTVLAGHLLHWPLTLV